MKRITVLLLVAMGGVTARAQDTWTVTILRDFASSEARAISGDEQFGVFTLGACGWAGTQDSFTSYAPNPLSRSEINGAYLSIKGGLIATQGSRANAAIWTRPTDFDILEPFAEGELGRANGDKLPGRTSRRIQLGKLGDLRFVIDFSKPIREPIPRWIK